MDATGYSPHASGLLVPDELARVRQVWTRDEWKTLNRATDLLNRKGIKALLKCEHPGCETSPVEKLRRGDGGFILRCAHADRIFQKAF